MREVLYEGTKTWFNLNLSKVGGFSMAQYDFAIYYYCSADKVIEVPKEKAFRVDDDNYMFLVDTGLTGRGKLRFAVLPMIPDERIDDAIRPEVLDEIDSGFDVMRSVIKLKSK